MMTEEKIKNPTMTANLILLQKKYARVIECFLLNSRDFHWIRHWDYFIILKSIS